MSEKIGIYVCECGPNIADKVHIDKIMEDISKLEDFKDKELVIRNHKLLCSVDGKKYLEDEINEHKLSHMVIAACSPRDHDSTFIGVCKKTELNPYLYKIINIREQCAWIIPDKDKATDKAVQYIHGGMSRVLYQDPLIEKELDSNPDVLVIGGGIAGMEAALNLASKDRRVFLIEKEETLGGKAALLTKLMPKQGSDLTILHQKISDVQRNTNITVLTKTVLDKIVGFMGNFETVLKNIDDENDIKEPLVGAIVVATGFELYDSVQTDNIKFSQEDNVIDGLEAERMFSTDNKISLKDGNAPKSVTLVHCVGREEVGFCSKICCNYLFKISNMIKEQSSDIKVTHLIKHLSLPTKSSQNFYNDAVQKGSHFERYNTLNITGTKVDFIDLNDENQTIESDMLILAPAMIPARGTKELSEMLSIDLHETGFYQEVHMKKDPISATTDGVFIIGAARTPGSIVDAIQQGKAATGKIFTQLIPGEKIIPEVMVSEILEAYCTGCQTCLTVCEYDAIYFDEDKGISIVNEAVCRGCGNCVGSCPSGSIRTRHFTNPQLYQEVKEILR